MPARQNDKSTSTHLSRRQWIQFVVLSGLVTAHPKEDQETLRRHPTHPRCFLYRNKPTVFITASEHYGAVLNDEFDYIPYLDELARIGLNHSRLFAFYRELGHGPSPSAHPPLGYANTLAPRPGHEVMPWKRTGPGTAPDAGARFDLNQWNPAYFARLKDFVGQARRRDIVVEVTLFCHPYTELLWRLFPFHKDSNVNGAGFQITDLRQFLEEHDNTVIEYQKGFVRKMVEELNEFDNLYYEICNEPAADFNGSTPEHAGRIISWQLAMGEVIRDTEGKLPKRHLIAINADQRILKYTEDGKHFVELGDDQLFDDPRVDILNYHSIVAGQPGVGIAVQLQDFSGAAVGNIRTFLHARSHVTKPIVYDENWAGIVGGAPDNWIRNRMEAWETIVCGGSGYVHLDWSFSPQDPLGSGKTRLEDGRYLDARHLRRQLGVLSKLWHQIGPAEMSPREDVVVSVPHNCLAFASSRRDGKVHVIYIADARPGNPAVVGPVYGEARLRLPKRRYRVKALPSGDVHWRELVKATAESSEVRISLPEFWQDCALLLEAS